MKTIRFILVMGAAAGLLFYNPTTEPGSVLLLCAFVLVFMIGMRKLSAKTPSKENQNTEQHD